MRPAWSALVLIPLTACHLITTSSGGTTTYGPAGGVAPREPVVMPCSGPPVPDLSGALDEAGLRAFVCGRAYAAWTSHPQEPLGFGGDGKLTGGVLESTSLGTYRVFVNAAGAAPETVGVTTVVEQLEQIFTRDPSNRHTIWKTPQVNGWLVCVPLASPAPATEAGSTPDDEQPAAAPRWTRYRLAVYARSAGSDLHDISLTERREVDRCLP